MKDYKQTDIVAVSKPHGGKRENSGRKLKNNEPTATIRLPLSVIEKIKAGYFENITKSNSDNSQNKCLRCCYYSDVVNHCSLNKSLDEQGNCADYQNVIKRINSDSFLIKELKTELNQYKPEEGFNNLKLRNSEYAALEKYCKSNKKSITSGLMNAIETAVNANKEIANYKTLAKKVESQLTDQLILKNSNRIFQDENKDLKNENMQLKAKILELQAKQAEYEKLENVVKLDDIDRIELFNYLQSYKKQQWKNRENALCDCKTTKGEKCKNKADWHNELIIEYKINLCNQHKNKADYI